MYRFMIYVFALIMHHCNLWNTVHRLCTFLEKKPILAVFTFHRVTPGPSDPRHLQGYERGITSSAFKRQIAYIANNFDIIDLDSFWNLIKGRRQPERGRPLALLTFDDADKHHYETAFPILAVHNIPAVSFIPTAFIGTPKRFYHLRLTNICNNFTDDHWKQALLEEMPRHLKEVLLAYAPHFSAHKAELRKQLIKPFENLQPAERDELLTRWGGMIKDVYTLDIECMTWDQVAALPALGIAIGSHTVNHNRLTMLSDSEIAAELNESKNVLESKTNIAVVAICYPEGYYDSRTIEAARRAGYELGFTADVGFADYPNVGAGQYSIARVGVADGPDYRISYSVGKVAIRRLIAILRARLRFA